MPSDITVGLTHVAMKKLYALSQLQCVRSKAKVMSSSRSGALSFMPPNIHLSSTLCWLLPLLPFLLFFFVFVAFFFFFFFSFFFQFLVFGILAFFFIRVSINVPHSCQASPHTIDMSISNFRVEPLNKRQDAIFFRVFNVSIPSAQPLRALLSVVQLSIPLGGNQRSIVIHATQHPLVFYTLLTSSPPPLPPLLLRLRRLLLLLLLLLLPPIPRLRHPCLLLHSRVYKRPSLVLSIIAHYLHVYLEFVCDPRGG
ncbi:hypothetical protein TcWFU_007521 [Taenia crassiceps]|uniref:Transmembrane protein n=1 Tax=Taenia crassiceps TaxID=6207 RepID=A0ABR4Q5U9_9CEST